MIDGETMPEPYWPLGLVGFDVNKAEMLTNVIEIRLILENQLSTYQHDGEQ